MALLAPTDDPAVDPTAPKKPAATTPTAPTLPFASAGQGAAPATPQTPNATAGQGLSPTQPHPLATSDPLAFAPPAGTLPIAQPPVGGAPGQAPNATPDAGGFPANGGPTDINYGGPPSSVGTGATGLHPTTPTAPINPALNVGGGAFGSTWNGQAPVTAQPGQSYGPGQAFQGTPAGWVDPDSGNGGGASAVNGGGANPTIPTGPQYEQQSTLSDWAKAHGFGSTQGDTDPTQIANEYLAMERNQANGSLPGQGTGFNATLDQLAKDAIANANTSFQSSLTNGGFAPGTSPNELPLTQMPGGTFQNQNGTPASQGGNSTTINNSQTGGQTPVDVAIGSGQAAGAPNGFNPTPPSTTPTPGGSTVAPPSDTTSLLPPSMQGPVASYGGPAPLAPSSNPNDLTNTTLARDPSIDRFALAKQNLKDFQDTTNPAYEASLRDANRYAFANGRGYSGIENNSIGDLASQRDTAIRGEQDTLLNQALNDTISDQFKDVGVQQQQQGFQAGQQQTGFTQGLQTEQQQQANQAQGFNQDIATKQVNNLLQNTAFGQQLSTQQLQDFENSTQFQQFIQMYMAGQIDDPVTALNNMAQTYARPNGGGY